MKQAAMAYVQLYEGKFGPNSRSLFGAWAWDAFMVFAAALPGAVQGGQPGTAAFRAALRDAIEQVKDLYGTCGVYAMSAANHNGTDARALVLITVEDGTWKLLQ